MPFKDECSMCGRVFPYSRLKRCWRCKRLFCLDCMVPDVPTSNFTRMLCLDCARKVVSPKLGAEHGQLTNYLRFRSHFTDTVKLPIAEVDGMIGKALPMDAYRDASWWEDASNNAYAKAWLNAGWEVHELNLDKGYVIFKKVGASRATGFKTSAYGDALRRPFTPAPARPSRTRKLSKTKIAKLYARLRNIERRRAEGPKYSGLKPKSAYEKRIFKPHVKLQG